MIPWRAGAKVGHVVDEATGCWNWTGATSWGGYGRVGVPGARRTQNAHRAYYEAARGPVAPGLDLDHLCRNRQCVNPDHLEPVTRAVNAHRGRGTKLRPEQVREIRARYAAGGVSQVRLGREYGVDSSIISDIVNFRMWLEVAA